MGCRVGHIVQWMEELAPPVLAADWDQIGLQFGAADRKVRRVLLALTVTADVVEQAARMSADLIVSHHPLIFRPLTELRWDRPAGALLRALFETDVAVYAAHTNFDAAEKGTSEVLARRLALQGTRTLVPERAADGAADKAGYGRVGELPEPMTPEAFLDFVVRRLAVTHVRHNGALPAKVERVAVMGGSGASFMAEAAREGADAYVTGDVKFHDAVDARALGLWLIDAGHFATERLLLDYWKTYLESRARAVDFDLLVAVAQEEDPFHLTLADSAAKEGAQGDSPV